MTDIQSPLASSSPLADEFNRSGRSLPLPQPAATSEEARFSRLAHDIRSPLTSLVGLADLLARRDSELTVAERVEIEQQLLQDARYMESIVSSISWLVRGIETEPQLVHRLVDGVVSRHVRNYPWRHIRVDVPLSLPLVEGNATGITEILQNLLENAEKYAGSGRPFEVTAEAQAPVVILKVRDFGRGVPANEIDKIFTWGYRRDRTDSTTAGTGVGLPLSRRLAELMGGELTVANAAEGGAEFRLTLKVVRELVE